MLIIDIYKYISLNIYCLNILFTCRLSNPSRLSNPRKLTPILLTAV